MHGRQSWGHCIELAVSPLFVRALVDGGPPWAIAVNRALQNRPALPDYMFKCFVIDQASFICQERGEGGCWQGAFNIFI